jgi:hypothetical protein
LFRRDRDSDKPVSGAKKCRRPVAGFTNEEWMLARSPDFTAAGCTNDDESVFEPPGSDDAPIFSAPGFVIEGENTRPVL